MKKPSAEELEQMREARCASLIRRWLTGKKLTDAEKGEISYLIPLHLLAAGPDSPAGQAAAKGALSTRKHAKYARTYPEYSKTYEVELSGRVVKRWVRRGKELNDLPPLDQPELMAGWWRRCMDHQVPDVLLALVKPPRVGASKEPPSSTESKSEDPSHPRDFSQVTGLGIEENVEELRRSHAINNQLLTEALHDGAPNENTISLRQRNYERTFELLRKAESTLIDLQKQRGDLIDKEGVRTELSQFLESLRLMRETMPHRITIEMERILPRRFQRVARLLEKYLVPATEKARADEESMFRNLETLNGPEAVKDLLAA
jgi:hypothetical protein